MHGKRMHRHCTKTPPSSKPSHRHRPIPPGTGNGPKKRHFQSYRDRVPSNRCSLRGIHGLTLRLIRPYHQQPALCKAIRALPNVSQRHRIRTFQCPVCARRRPSGLLPSHRSLGHSSSCPERNSGIRDKRISLPPNVSSA